MPQDFEKAIVRIHHQDGSIMGAGFLTAGKQVVTCAHVVSSSFGLEEVPLEFPRGEIRLDFPLVAPGQVLIARVVNWRPEKDITLLEIVGNLPEQVFVSSMFRFHEITDHVFHVYGFPAGSDYGIWSFGRILGPNAMGHIQIESTTSYVVRPGFSGSLVWDSTEHQVVGIITETDRDAEETKTAYFLPINSILDCFPHLESILEEENHRVKYACFISYPNDVGVQGQLVREFAEGIYDALSVELGGMLDIPIFFDREHIHGNTDIAKAICESACFLMVLTPKYFSERMPLCALEFKAMQDLESTRLRNVKQPVDLSFIIPVRPFSRDILPMGTIGPRRDYDFHEMTVSGNLRTHPHYGPLIRQLAEHIYRCYQLLESCEQDPCLECADFGLPSVDQARDLFQATSLRRFSKFPIR